MKLTDNGQKEYMNSHSLDGLNTNQTFVFHVLTTPMAATPGVSFGTKALSRKILLEMFTNAV